jgi:hypothetical protein
MSISVVLNLFAAFGGVIAAILWTTASAINVEELWNPRAREVSSQ